MNRLVGVGLDGRIGEVGDDAGLIDERPRQRFGGARVELSAVEVVSDRGVDQSPSARIQWMGEAEPWQTRMA